MATFAIGDVHGNYTALDDLLRILKPEIRPSDVVALLGDYIDRGPDTRQCIDRWFEGLREHVQAADCFYDGPDVIVYGHHNNAAITDRGWPLPAIAGRTIGIDTNSHGVLTAGRLPDGSVFQSARHRNSEDT